MEYQDICDLFYQHAHLDFFGGMLFIVRYFCKQKSHPQQSGKSLQLLPVGFAVAMSTSMTLRLLLNIRRSFEPATFANTGEVPSTLIAGERSQEIEFDGTIEPTGTQVAYEPERNTHSLTTGSDLGVSSA